MPIIASIREGETGGIVFPLTQNSQPFPYGNIDHIEIVLSGLDGQLAGTVITDVNRVIPLNDGTGDVVFFPLPGDLQAAYSPYRIYFRIFSDNEGHFVTVPEAPTYYLLFVEDNLL